MTASARYIAVDDNHTLSIGQHEPGQPGSGELLIAVNAAGINRPDLMQRYGLYPPPAGASPILGLEVAGTVLAVGDDVSAWKVGDRVCALCNGGGYSDQVLVPASQCLPIPGALSDIEAAALPETYFTVWYNVFERGALRPGERFLVHGGSSGIGTTAITLAGAMGATVYATAGNAEKCAACESLGASRAINYNEEDFVEVLKEETDGQGIDVILDMVGGDYVQRNFQVAAVEGRIANIAFAGGFRSEINFLRLRLFILRRALIGRHMAHCAMIDLWHRVRAMSVMRTMILSSKRRGRERCCCENANPDHSPSPSGNGRTVTTCIMPACMW